jgi:GNAT superfamily N-acetyltransferase
MPLPGSQNSAHINQNLDSLNFILSEADMCVINAKARSGKRERITASTGVGFIDEFDFPYEQCWPKKIELEILHGHEIAPYVKEVVQFVNKIYRNYPYFYNGDDAGYEAYLESFPNIGDVIVCLAFEGAEVIGIAVGLPMSKRHVYQEILLEHDYDIKEIFYLGEFGLKPEYQEKGIASTMYQNIEKFANKSGQFNKICFWEIENTSGKNNSSYFPSDDFWKQFGFIQQPELNFQILWTNIGNTKESAHKAVYWMKNLKDQ